ncbi:MAG TPA: hypothetical protein VMY88_01195 [Acidimicrobiales bacterium]|nr:hypothetical protein [Acidimicrobiales bacterium]
MTVTAPAAKPRTKGGVLAAAKLAFATVGTRGRLIASVGGVLFFVALALILQTSADLAKAEAREIAVASFFLLLLPLMCVSNASIAFGNAVQDNTLVYIWLRPIARWKLAVAHVAATVASLLPMIIALSLSIFLFGSSVKYVGSVAMASVMTAVGYSGPVVALGARFKRASMIAITYVILVESILGGLAAVGRFSIRNYGVALFVHASGEKLDLSVTPGALTSVLVLVGACAAGIALTTWFLKRADVA